MTDGTEWLGVRTYLRRERAELTDLAGRRYPDRPRVGGTDLLTQPAWSFGGVIGLDRIDVSYRDGAAPDDWPATDHLLPAADFSSYAQAMGALAAPSTFVNRTTYRLLAGDLRADRPWLAFGPGRYFDSIDIGEACAHELAAHRLGLIDATPLRDAIGDPCDPARRPTNVAISALTLRRDPASGTASFPLHWRDPAKVGHAGGLSMVVPAGVFQAATDRPEDQVRDLSLWQTLKLEYAEEMLGLPEHPDTAGHPLLAALSRAYGEGRIRVSVVGLGVDPLTLATDLLAVAVFEAPTYDQLFGELSDTNEEGRLLSSSTGAQGGRFEFSHDSIERLLATTPMQAAGAAVLRRAWQEHATLLAH